MSSDITRVIDAVVLGRAAFPRGGLVCLDEVPQQVLLVIAEEGERTVADISRRLWKLQPSISVAAAELERLGYVEGAIDPRNKRRRRLSISGPGRAVVDEYIAALGRREQDYVRQRQGPADDATN